MAEDFVLAVDVGGTKTALAAVTREGGVLARARLPTCPEEGARSLVGRIVARGRELVSGTSGALRGIGAVSPGVVLEDRIMLAPNVPGLERTALAGELRGGFGVGAVGAGNDVKAAARAEARWGALAGSPCGIFLNLGTGLAVSVVVDGVVLDGAHGAAGELGYQLRGVQDLPPGPAGATPVRPPGLTADGTRGPAPDGGPQPWPPAGAEPPAPLEEYVSGKALSERGSALLGHAADTEEVFAAAELKPGLERLVADALDTLAVHVTNLSVVLDPDRIVAGGGMLRGAGGERILVRLREVLARAAPFPVEVRRGRFADDAALLGAALLGWEAADRPPSAG